MVDKPILRALTVFSEVAQHGPITLKDLVDKRPEISRPAIWRALNNLRDAGWVRMQRGSNAWIATHVADDVLGNAQLLPRAVEELAPRLPPARKGLLIMMGTFMEYGRFEIVESSETELIGNVLPLIGDPMAFSGLAIAEEADMLRHLIRWMEVDASPEERDLITSGELTQGLRRARANPALQLSKGRTIPHRADDGSVAVAWVKI